MDFQSRAIVNGSLLRQKIGENISILIKVVTVEGAGRVIKGKSTDNLDIRVMLTEPITTPLNDWIEVIGVPSAGDVIKCKEVILFDKNDQQEELDTSAHNMAVLFLAECQRDFYKTK